MFVFALTLVPLSFGMGFGMPTISSLVSQCAGAHEQGRVQGVASSVESLSRTLGPVAGTLLLARYGTSSPYLAAAFFMVLTLLLTVGYHGAAREPLAAQPG